MKRSSRYIRIAAVLVMVVVLMLLIVGCGEGIISYSDGECASCEERVSELIRCPWCGAYVCKDCYFEAFANDDMVDVVRGSFLNDNYFVYHTDDFYKEAWEEVFIPDAEYNLDEFNEFLSEYGYKLEKTN